MTRFKFWLLLICITFLQACASMGPLDTPEFLPTVKKALLAEDGEVRLAHHAPWHPNVKGFNDAKQNGLNILFGELPPKIDGVLAFTDHSLSMMEWDEGAKQYDVIKRLAFVDLREAEVERFAGISRMVFRSKDLSYQTFYIYASSQDSELPVKAVALVKAKITKN